MENIEKVVDNSTKDSGKKIDKDLETVKMAVIKHIRTGQVLALSESDYKKNKKWYDKSLFFKLPSKEAKKFF
jgi:hypothetical protein